MESAFITVAGGVLTQQSTGQSAGYTLDFAGDLAAGDTITGATWNVLPTGLPNAIGGFSATTASIRIEAGAPVGWYLIQCTAATVGGDALQQEFRIYIQDSTILGAGIVSAFPSLPAAVASLRRDRLIVALQTFAPGVTLQDDYLLEKLVAAEQTLQRALRVFFTPRAMLPFGALQSEIDALTAAGKTVEMEPGYDYDPDMFQGNMWGLIEVRQKPIICVHSITFNYPAPSNVLFTVPTEWIRPDLKYGRINLVPVQTAMSLPLNAFILSALGGGRTVPLMLQVRYSAGIANCAQSFPDILDLIKKETVLSIVDDTYVPASGSVSADGLSQSISFQAESYRKTIEAKIERLRQAIHGIRTMVM
jgi:hypothetical protein